MGKVKITEHHFSSRSTPKTYTFNPHSDFNLKWTGQFGFSKIQDRHADLLDIALSIYQFEKMQSKHSLRNPVVKVEMDIWLRIPEVWNEENQHLLIGTLNMMGNAEWIINIHKNRLKDIYPVEKTKRNIEKVILFSGGIDSTAGIASLADRDYVNTLLFSFYSKQKTLQKEIASAIGFNEENHMQFWCKALKEEMKSRNRSFFYRSILFLFSAAILADSHNCSKVLQFENGILSTSIPPTPSITITKHAHPMMHYKVSKLLSNIFETEFIIENPFLSFTKKECVEKGYAKFGREKFDQVLMKTETCWFKYSNFDIRGKQKKSNKECGFCIPCIIKRTALPHANFAIDLNSKRGAAIRNDLRAGEGFRSYYAFTQKILAIKNNARSRTEFYKILPMAGRVFFDPKFNFPIKNPSDVIYRMFRKFAEEFHQTFDNAS